MMHTLNNFLFLFITLLSSVLAIAVVAVLSTSGRLHTLVFVGDLDFLVASVLIGVSLTAMMLRVRRRTESGTNHVLDHLSECSFLYAILLLAIFYSLTNTSPSSSGLADGYVLAFITNATITLLAHFFLTKTK